MGNQQERNALAALLDEKMRHFASSFLESSRQLFADEDGQLVHPGEFGTYRESITKDFLKSFIPQRMAIDSGFIITSSGRISSQCDIVIYDKSVTPLIQNENRQRFFPVESVCAVGEIKSVLSLSDLKSALRKLASVKGLRDCLFEPNYVYCAKEEGLKSRYMPEYDERDQMLTFLICESFSFDLSQHAQEIMSCYSEGKPNRPFCHRHNLILSIKDALVTYLHPSGVIFPFPSKYTVVANCDDTDKIKSVSARAELMKHRVIFTMNNSYEHIRHFCTLIHQGLFAVSVLFPDMGRYIQSQEDSLFLDFDQKR